jgi:hypothetical protein
VSDYEHPCSPPRSRRRWKNKTYICECGKAWRLVFHFNYADAGWLWERAPNDDKGRLETANRLLRLIHEGDLDLRGVVDSDELDTYCSSLTEESG